MRIEIIDMELSDHNPMVARFKLKEGSADMIEWRNPWSETTNCFNKQNKFNNEHI